MIAPPDPEDVIARIPGWSPQDTKIETPLSGLTNRSFRVRSGAAQYVLRLDAAHTRALGLDRQAEAEALHKAAAAGLGPEVEFVDPAAGILVTRFVGGTTLSRADLDSKAVLGDIARLLRRVHALEPCGRVFDAAGAAARYAAGLAGDDALHATAARCLRVIADAPAPTETRFCHNDVVAENVIRDGRLLLLDWEYACDNDPIFDLATPAAYHELGSGQRRALVSAYCGGPSAEAMERLDEQIRVCDALHWIWLALRESIAPLARQRRRLARLRDRIFGRG